MSDQRGGGLVSRQQLPAGLVRPGPALIRMTRRVGPAVGFLPCGMGRRGPGGVPGIVGDFRNPPDRQVGLICCEGLWMGRGVGLGTRGTLQPLRGRIR